METIAAVIREDQCTRADKCMCCDHSDLGWPVGKWPTRVRFMSSDGDVRLLTNYRVVRRFGGNGIEAIVYSDDSGFCVEVVNA